MTTRRDFLHAGTTAALVAATPPWVVASLRERPPSRRGEVLQVTDPAVRELALRAVEAARQAGATYADARLTHIYERSIDDRRSVSDTEEMAVGVRALFNGYWGFASSPMWTPDEMTRLGREALAVAKVNAGGRPRLVELAPVQPNETGHWETALRINPFEVPVDEIIDFLSGIDVYVGDAYPGIFSQTTCQFTRREEAFASTDGAYLTQVFITTGAGFGIGLEKHPEGEESRIQSDLLLPAARGWEYVRDSDATLRAEPPHLAAILEADWRLPRKPVDVGRYDLVLDASGMVGLLDATLGTATELDRALGYEANASGTSYLDDPAAMLGTLQVASSLVTVTANRSTPGALGTARWDAEGVQPADFTLVKDGVLSDYQTTREAAGWLKGTYSKRGTPLRSRGCANAQSALFAPTLFSANLRLEPGKTKLSLEGLIAGMDRGVCVRGLSLGVDFQQRDGWSERGYFYEVKGGKRVARLEHAGLLFRTTDLWKALTALGGPESFRLLPSAESKGEPAQTASYSVGAVPACFKQQTIIDSWRKA